MVLDGVQRGGRRRCHEGHYWAIGEHLTGSIYQIIVLYDVICVVCDGYAVVILENILVLNLRDTG